jgi:hypothetical protein
VSVAKGAGTALITGNLITGARDGAIRAMQEDILEGPDLAQEGPKAYPNLTIDGNVVR